MKPDLCMLEQPGYQVATHAASAGHLDSGGQQCDIGACDDNGNTALHLACQAGDTSEAAIASLLQRGADPLAVNASNQTAFEVAILNHNFTSAAMLGSRLPGSKVNANLPCGHSPLHVAQVR